MEFISESLVSVSDRYHLPKMSPDIEKEQVTAPKNTHCLICNSQVAVSTRNCFEIFHKDLTTATSERPLSLTIGAVLGLEIREDTVHSNVICKKCLKLINEVDEIETRLKELRVEINSNYQRTIKLQTEGGKDSPLPNKDGEPKLSLGADDEKVKKRFLEGVRKESTPEKTESSHSAEDKQKEITFCVIHLKEQNSGAHFSEMILGNDDTENIAVQGNVKINLEPEDGDSRRMIGIKRMEMESQTAEKVVAREGVGFLCLLCNGGEKIVGDMKGIVGHLKGVHNVRIYICDVCGQDFRKRKELSAHLDNHVTTEEGCYQCEVCSRIFSNLRLFRVHRRMHNQQSKLWVCEACGKRYNSRNLLHEHINIHTGVRPYVCEACGKEFASKYTYKAHTKIHEVRPRPYCCNKCGKTFLTSHNLAQHERTHTDIRNYLCDQCGKAFCTARSLEMHSVVHSDYKPFTCRICGKGFARKAEIRDHERTHTGEKPYQCEFCSAAFCQRSNLQSHKRATHYQDKRFKCENCGKGFKRRRLLEYHVKAAHTGERPYKCPTCDATFVYPEHFKKHHRIHTGEKPYSCEVCGKAFSSRDNRNAHRFVHSDKKAYECLVCGMGFMRKSLLYNHMRTQGHINDTIVVNQSHVATDEDLAAEAAAEAVEVQMTTVGEDPTPDQETKLYIAGLKDHVIIRNDGDDRVYAERTAVVGSDDSELKDGEQHIVPEAVEHLIIGQLHFANPNELAHMHADMGCGAEITVTTSNFVRSDEGRCALVVSATPHVLPSSTEAFEGSQVVDQETGTTATRATTQSLQTSPVHLVQVHIPTVEHRGNREEWLNIEEIQQ